MTSDGSHTLFNPDFGETYHSEHGAVQESRHVFINAGFHEAARGKKKLCIFEVGFGTGLNALLTHMESSLAGIRVEYTAVEAFPLPEDVWQKLNFGSMPGLSGQDMVFGKLHEVDWGKKVILEEHFSLEKIYCRLEDFKFLPDRFDLVYFDAFSPASQPELWTSQIFAEIYRSMKPGGVLTTYCVKGDAVRAMKEAGFRTAKLPGPPGKRHITRAVK
jgi:tRNA U34 5-methylaminomethyl-2-thiouridine-forming methyltransferase MnmC